MLLDSNVYPIELSSVLASMLFEEKSIDVIYLDGCHQKQDLKIYSLIEVQLQNEEF